MFILAFLGELIAAVIWFVVRINLEAQPGLFQFQTVPALAWGDSLASFLGLIGVAGLIWAVLANHG